MNPDVELAVATLGRMRIRATRGMPTPARWPAPSVPRTHGEITATIRAMGAEVFGIDELMEALPPGPGVDGYELLRIAIRMCKRGELRRVEGVGLESRWKRIELGTREIRKSRKEDYGVESKPENSCCA